MDSQMPRATETKRMVVNRDVEMPVLTKVVATKRTVESMTVQPVIAKENKPPGLKVSDNLGSEGVEVTCGICDKPQPLSVFSTHISTQHLLTLSEYEKIYKRFYNHIRPDQRAYHECKLCGDFVLLDMSEIATHLKAAKHPIKNSEYIEKYCKTERRGTKRRAKKGQTGPQPKTAKIEPVNSSSVPQEKISEDKSSKHISQSSGNTRPCPPPRNISKTVTLEERVSSKSTELSLTHFTESSVKKSTVLEKLHDFDLDEILRKIEENPRSVSACDLL